MRPGGKIARRASSPGQFHADISVFIISYNEEKTIERCLNSVAWSNDIVVLDSFSTDATLSLARSRANVRCYQRHFEDFSDQRNFGLHEISFAHPWVLIVDADEVVSPGLPAEMQSTIRRPEAEGINAFLLRRYVAIEGRVLRWNSTASFWIGRLVRPKQVHYEGKVHERLQFSGPAGKLKGRLIHEQFSKGLDHWRIRSAKYAELEAAAPPDKNIGPLIAGNTLQRRAVLKKAFYATPGAWMGYLIFNVFFSFAFLDGRRGLRYVYLQAQYHKLTAHNIRSVQNA